MMTWTKCHPNLCVVMWLKTFIKGLRERERGTKKVQSADQNKASVETDPVVTAGCCLALHAYITDGLSQNLTLRSVLDLLTVSSSPHTDAWRQATFPESLNITSKKRNLPTSVSFVFIFFPATAENKPNTQQAIRNQTYPLDLFKSLALSYFSLFDHADMIKWLFQ